MLGLNTAVEVEQQGDDPDQNANSEQKDPGSLDLPVPKAMKKRGEKPENTIASNNLQDHYNLKERKPTDYYYKRWLWIQFPWACLSLKCDYSAKMKQCFSSTTKYMSVVEERAFTKQALKIAIEAKLNKKLMYAKAEDSQLETIKSFADKEVSIIQKKEANNNNMSLLSFNRSQAQFGLYNMKSGETQDLNEPTAVKQQTFTGLKHPITKRHDQSQQFFLTEEYLSLNTLNKEIESQMKDNAVVRGKASHFPSMDGQNTTKILNKSRTVKDKSKFFDAQNVNYSVTQSILPRLKSTIINHSCKEMNIMEGQANSMKKEYDNLVYGNNVLAKKLKQLKTIYANESVESGNQDGDNKVSTTYKKIEEVKSLKKQEDDGYLFSLLQKERLKIILKICGDNKQYNEKWIRSLNFLLNNMKKLINVEEEEILSHESEIEQTCKVHESYVEAFNEKMFYQQRLIDNLRCSLNNKKNLDEMFHRSDQIIEQSSLQTIEKIKQDQKSLESKRQQQNKINQMEKNKQAMNDKLEQLQETFRRVCELIDIGDVEYTSSLGFQKFLEQLDQKSGLEMKILNQEERILKIQQELQSAQNHLQTIKNAEKSYAKQRSVAKKSSMMQMNESQQLQLSKSQTMESHIVPEEDEQLTLQDFDELQSQVEKDHDNKVRLLSKLQQVKLNCLMSFSMLQQKLNVAMESIDKSKIIEQDLRFDNFNYAKVSEVLDAKHQKVKQQLNEPEYRQLLSEQYDFLLMYKHATQYYQHPILAEMEMD